MSEARETIDRVEAIRRRAYEIWQAEGQIEGRDKEHWAEAEKQIDAATAAPSATAPVAGDGGLIGAFVSSVLR
jgi:Protein of unknown function (DUF2934)